MKKSILLASAFAVLSAGVMAEEFENRAYKARDMPAVQYDAIRSGLYSECDSKAQSIAKQGAQRPQNCEAYKQLYGSWNTMAYMECQKAMDSNQMDKKAFVNVFIGCMAKEGWVLE